MKAFLVVLALLCPGAAAADAALLEALIGEYVASQQISDRRDPVFSVESGLAELEEKSRLAGRLRAIGEDGLSQAQRTDLRYLIGVLSSDIRTAKAQKRWENDPSMYLPARQLGALLDPDHPLSPRDREPQLVGVFESLQQGLDHARRQLGSPPERFTREAIFQSRSTLQSLQASAAAFAGLEVAGRFDAAISALDAYIVFLEEELLPRSTGNWMLGKAEYDFILQNRWHMDATAEDILQRGRKAFEETSRQARVVAQRISPGAHWTEVYETLKSDHPTAAGLKQAYQDDMDAAREFVIEKRIVSLPEGESVITLDTPPAMRRSSPFGTFQSVSPFGEELQGRLILTPVEDWMSPGEQADRLRSHHFAWTPVIAVHEAYPGHHVHALKLRENPRPLRKIAREAIFTEGWGLFTEELMFEAGFLKGDKVRLTQLRNRLWRAARVILDSSLHTGRMSFDEAVDFLVREVRFERYAAELEVGMYIRRPTYVLGYLIGMQEIMAIREAWIEKHGEPDPPSRFYDSLLTVGSLPPALVRDELLGSGID